MWSLTFGDLSDEHCYRHAMGRAKGFGYGKLKPGIVEFVAKENSPNSKLLGTEHVKKFVDEFTCYMDTHLPTIGYGFAFEQSPTIIALRAMADPKNGKKYERRLEVMQLPSFRNIKKMAINSPDPKMLCDFVKPEAWNEMQPDKDGAGK